jgi:hypothetical protein
MDYYGFDDLLEVGERHVPIERQWHDDRVQRAREAAQSFFQVIPSIRDRALVLANGWKTSGKIAHHHLHIIFGLAYMHACAEYRGGSVVFPTQVLDFVNSANGFKTRYAKVIQVYQSICENLSIQPLLVHPESGIRHLIAAGTEIESGEVVERVVSKALELYSQVSSELIGGPQGLMGFQKAGPEGGGHPIKIEFLLAACLQLSLRFWGVRDFSREALRRAAFLNPKSNNLEKWARKISEKLETKIPQRLQPSKRPAARKTQINNPAMNLEISNVTPPSGLVVTTTEQLLDF